jgi:CubicO group peptidase (beta-lactamase class C family)
MSTWMKPKLVHWLVVACLLTLAGCTGGEECETSLTPLAAAETPTVAVEDVIWPGDDWEMSTPEAEGMNAAQLEDVAAYCEEHGCRAVVIIRHGRIVWERYWDGWDEDSTDISWSMAKSITSALVGIAIGEGKIESLDQSAADFIEEWRGTDREKITLRNLISMTSGLSWSMIYDPPSGDTVKMLGSDDRVGYAVAQPLYREPGSDWYYSDGDAESFSRILKAATGMEASEYAQQKLFGPIGIEGATWLTDEVGQTMTFCCVYTTARDFARFGYLFLRNGRWGDQQVVPEAWVRESTRPSQWENPQYGYYWWLLDLADVPEDTYSALGFQTKRIHVIPSLDIVAVRLGKGDDEWDDNAFLKPIVEAVTD